MKTYCNSLTTITLHAKRYTKGELKGTWRGYVKITHYATIDDKDHICKQYHWTPDYIGHLTREDALASAQIVKDQLL